MAAEYASVILRLVLVVVKFVPNIAKKLWNYWKRPKLHLKPVCVNIEFETSDSKTKSPIFPAIRVTNKDKHGVTIDLNKTYINGESLTYIIQENTYFALTNNDTKSDMKLSTKNILLNIFRDNWTASKFIKIAAYEDLDIPICPKKMSDSLYFNVLEDANVFFPKRKFVITIKNNSRESHFAINRMEFLKIIVNYLVYDRG
jgi:hypothetical protein